MTTITTSLHITVILTMALMSFYISTSTNVLYRYGTTLINSVSTAVVSMESIDYPTRFLVTLAGSIVAGILGATVSQPGDTLLSVVNRQSKKTPESANSSVLASASATAMSSAKGLKVAKAELADLECDVVTEICAGAADLAQGAGADKVDPIQLMKDTVDELGIKGLYNGFQARLAHVMLIVSVQLISYDFLKGFIGSAFNR